MGIINASIIVNTTTIRTIYVGLKCKPTWKYVFTTKSTIHGSIMLIHVFVIQLPRNIYYGLFWCSQKDDITKEDLTIWEYTIKEVKIISHFFILLAKYINQNMKIWKDFFSCLVHSGWLKPSNLNFGCCIIFINQISHPK
jgi:hypothetical protein